MLISYIAQEISLQMILSLLKCFAYLAESSTIFLILFSSSFRIFLFTSSDIGPIFNKSAYYGINFISLKYDIYIDLI